MQITGNIVEHNLANPLSRHSLRIWILLGVAAFLFVLTHSVAARADATKDMQDCQNIQRNAPRSQADFCDGLRAFRAKDYAHALQSLNTAGKEGNGQAYSLAGYMYEQGRGVAIDSARAFSYYKQSAALGSADGMHSVARCYRYGIGTPINEPEAKIWFAKAAAGGTEEGPEPLPGTQHAKPDQADFEAGAKAWDAKNYNQAVQYFRRAADLAYQRTASV